MTQRAFRTVTVGVPWAMCTIVPTLIFGVLFGQWGTNLVWGHVFGFGWFVAQSYFGPEGWRTAAAIGILIWPPLVLLALFFASGIAWRAGDGRWRRRVMLAIGASCLPIVPAQTVSGLYAGARVPADFNVLWNGY